MLYWKDKEKMLWEVLKKRTGSNMGGGASIEYEYSFLDIDENKIKNKLKELGAKRIYDKTLFKINIYSHPTNQKKVFIRLRDEGDKITFTIKTNYDKGKFPLEHEIIIDDFDEMDKMLTLMGCKRMYVDEKMREKWKMKRVKEIVFDSVPGIPTYMEVEAATKEDLLKSIKKLGLSEKDAIKGISYFKHYYGIEDTILEKVTSLTFNNVNKVLGKHIKKNKKLFNETNKKQRKYKKLKRTDILI